MAVVFGFVISRKAMHYLPLVGMALLAAGILVFTYALPANQPLAMVGSALTGLALGATVAPALFVAGFSLQSASLQRVFAIIELMRAVAAFMVAPILAHIADALPGDLAAGTGTTLWIGFGLAIGGAIFGVAIYLLSGARPQKPDLDEFLDGESPAWYSPPLLARIRSGLPSPVPAIDHHEPVTAAPQRQPTSVGPVVFAYDGSDLAACAIEQAASQLPQGRCALVVCVWQPAHVGFTPVDEEALRRRSGHRGAAGRREHGGLWRVARGEGRIRGGQHGGGGGADVEGHRGGSRGKRSKPDRAWAAPAQRAGRASAGQRGGCRHGALDDPGDGHSRAALPSLTGSLL